VVYSADDEQRVLVDPDRSCTLGDVFGGDEFDLSGVKLNDGDGSSYA
jgi:hypothetical protein